jgi:hypothetical protein
MNFYSTSWGRSSKKAVPPVRFGKPNPVHHMTVDKYYQKSQGAAQDSPRRYVLRVVNLKNDNSGSKSQREVASTTGLWSFFTLGPLTGWWASTLLARISRGTCEFLWYMGRIGTGGMEIKNVFPMSHNALASAKEYEQWGWCTIKVRSPLRTWNKKRTTARATSVFRRRLSGRAQLVGTASNPAWA